MLGIIPLIFVVGCLRASEQREVIVYAALDREFSAPILAEFEQQTGIRVRCKYDTESTKTVGLTSQIIAESKRRGRCDVFWNNEILNTLRLDELGLLAALQPRQRDGFPARFRSAEDRWFGFAARARVLIVNTDLVPPEQLPRSLYDLLDPRWKGEIGIAKPLFGTTATHAVCLFERLGDADAKAFFQRLKENQVQVMSGNKQVAEDVAAGRIAFGLTDTDDAIIEREQGFPVTIVYPDSAPGELGTLLIPNTLCMLQGSGHPAEARALVDFLLTEEVERRLSAGPSAQIPLHAGVASANSHGIPDLESLAIMQVDFAQAVARWQEVSEFLRQTF